MRRHDIDFVSLAFGVIFLVMGLVFAAGRVEATDLVRWGLPLTALGLGIVLAAVALNRVRKESALVAEPPGEPERWTEPAGTQPEQPEPAGTQPGEAEPADDDAITTTVVDTSAAEAEPIEDESVEHEPVKSEPIAEEPVEGEPVEGEPDEGPHRP